MADEVAIVGTRLQTTIDKPELAREEVKNRA